jgi:DNA-binding NtrC family response regulator
MAVPNEATPTLNPNSIESQLIIEYCFDYITLPIDVNRLIFSLEHAIRINQLTRPYKSQTNENSLNFGIIGNSKVMVNLFRQLQKVSKEDCSVLIQGETGTGKELIANAVHNF